MGNLFLFCENLKSKDGLISEDSIEIADLNSISYEDREIFKEIKDILNLAYFPGTYSLDAFNSEISLTINKEYFKYVLSELKEIIDISSIEYLDNELVFIEGSIR